VRFGPLELNGLPVGAYRPLTPVEIRTLKRTAASLSVSPS
jgi:16S rRNA U516 pseudouridylate synthase RsuA-like enzyme